jgi:hypothetical protein
VNKCGVFIVNLFLIGPAMLLLMPLRFALALAGVLGFVAGVVSAVLGAACFVVRGFTKIEILKYDKASTRDDSDGAVSDEGLHPDREL